MQNCSEPSILRPVTSSTDDTAGYPRKRARTRRALLTAGRLVLAAKGPDGATVGEIAKRAKVSSGTFYNHFPSLDDLIDAVVGELATGVEIGRDTLTVIENDPAMRVMLGARQLLALADEDPASASAFVALLATVPAFRDRVRSIVEGALTEGIAAGRFADHDAMALTDAVLGSCVQWMRTALAEDGRRSASDRHDRLRLLMVLVGVSADEIPALLRRADEVSAPA